MERKKAFFSLECVSRAREILHRNESNAFILTIKVLRISVDLQEDRCKGQEVTINFTVFSRFVRHTRIQNILTLLFRVFKSW